MKQTARHILSLVLSFVMLVSMMTVFTSAANNYVPDDEYYEGIHKTSYIVVPKCNKLTKGEKLTYVFRGKTYTEDYDPEVHYPTIQAAFDAYVEDGMKSPVIALAKGDYTDPVVITDSITLIGANAGINPVKKGAKEGDVWTENPARYEESESNLKGAIFVKRTVKQDIEVKFDGVTLLKGFSYIEVGTREKKSTVYCENTVINGAGNASYETYAASDVFSFANSTKTENIVNIKNTLVKNMSSSNVVGVGVTKFSAEGVLFTKSQGGLMGGADALKNQEPNYNITNCMFYNNESTTGVISLDHSINDNATRTVSRVNISKCWFIDGPDTPTTADAKKVSPIQITITGTKNELNVTDCYFEGKNCTSADEEEIKKTAPVVSIGLSAAAKSAELKNKIVVRNNVCIGYPCLPDTTGMTATSTIDFTGNFFAISKDAEQRNPVYPVAVSYDNVYMDYYYINEAKTIKSTQFEIKSFGIDGAKIDHKQKVVEAIVDFDYKAKVNIQAKDNKTTIKLYNSAMKEVTEIDASKLASGVKKNVFYAVATSNIYPSYSNTYKVYISTFDPAKALDFAKAGHYMLADEVSGLANGTTYYTTWDGVAYRFTVGKNVFANIEDIYNVCGKNVPTVIIPAGSYAKTIRLTRSTVLLGAKHGINPNIPDFENLDFEWRINEDRASADEETVLNCVVSYEPTDANSFVMLDGFTFGKDSGFADTTKNENTYTNSSVENCIVDGAGGGKYDLNGTPTTLGAVFNIGAAATDISTSYKTFHLKNLRMVSQLNVVPLGYYFNRLIMDGCYIANNTHNQLFANEVTAPKGQDFYFELKNSCFHKNVTTTYYFVVNNAATYSKERKSSRLVFDNNTFYETNSNVNGIFGIRFQGATDSLLFTRNNFISSTATSFIPGYENWFIGKSGYKAAQAGEVDPSTLEPLTREMIQIRNNRFMGKVISSTPNIIYTHEKTEWDFSENYFASSYGKTVKGTAITTTTNVKTFCDSYYDDFDMTKMITPSDKFNTDLSYEFYDADKTAKTFKAVAKDTDETYEFKYDLFTTQAKVKIYTDAACDEEHLVENPVALSGGNNVFYVVFESYDGTVKDTYTATITKKASTGATIERFGNWKISGKAITACVAVGQSQFKLPEIEVSNGATYKIYDNSACTKEFKGDTIPVPFGYPTSKYIKVTSQDGKTVNIYSITVNQAENDQAVLTGVPNGTRTSDNLFTAKTNTAEYKLDTNGYVSDGATVQVYDGKDELVNINGVFTVESIVTEKTVKVVVASKKGASNTFNVRIIRGSDDTSIERIQGMYSNGDDDSEYFTYIADAIFFVVPALANDRATFGVYSDRACTVPEKNNSIVPSKHDTVAYLKVTSADGTATKVVKLNVESALIAPEESLMTEVVYEIKDAVADENKAHLYTITLPAGTSKYTVNVGVKDEAYNTTTFAVFADPANAVRLCPESPVGTPVEIELTGRNTRLYFRIYVKRGETGLNTETPVVNVISPRKNVTYTDQGTIAKWAADEIAFLNDNGYGYFVGDANGNFNPTAGISRFEVAVVVAKILGINTKHYETKRNPFYDNVPKWAHPYVVAVKELGIMAGKDLTTFAGQDPTTRQEFARIIAGTLAILNREQGTLDEIYENNKTLVDYDYSQYTFVDEKSVSKWARSAIKLSVSHYKVMSGSKEGDQLYLNPKKAITRQEVAVLVANLSGYEG